MRLNDVLTLARTGPDQNEPLAKKKISFAGFPIVIEYPAGSVRELKNSEGKVVYKKLMAYSYGYFEDTKGRDPDEVDVILGPNEKCKEVFVAHMIDRGPDVSQREDEDKVLLGFSSYDQAKKAFFSMYPVTFWGGATVLPLETFREKLDTAQLPHRHKKIHANRF